MGSLIEKFSQLVPDEAEVVVDFRFSVGGAGRIPHLSSYASGTALILRKKS